jgi:hypothetical protein
VGNAQFARHLLDNRIGRACFTPRKQTSIGFVADFLMLITR